MKKKIIGIVVCMLMIATAVLPVVGNINIEKIINIKSIDNVKVKLDQKNLVIPNSGLNPLSWSDIELVSTGANGDSYASVIAVDSWGTVHIVWMDDTDNYVPGSGIDIDIFYISRSRCGSWSSPELVSTNSNDYSYVPSIAVENSPAGPVVNVVWTEYNPSPSILHGILYNRRDSTGSWLPTGPELVSIATDCMGCFGALAVQPDGTVHTVWWDDTSGGWDVMYNMRGPGVTGSWLPGGPEIVSDDLVNRWSVDPSLDVEPNGIVHVVWDYDTGGNDWKVYYNYRDSTGNWQPNSEMIFPSASYPAFPFIAVDASGIPHVVWCEIGYLYCNILYSYRKDAVTGWLATPEIVGSASSIYFNLDVDTTNTVHVVWQYLEDIYYNKRDPSNGNWGATPVLISVGSTEFSEVPFLTVEAGGTVHITWTDEHDYGGVTGPDLDVFYIRGGGTDYYSVGPGRIIAIGIGNVNRAAGNYCLSGLGFLWFKGISSGGPSFVHFPPAFQWTEGQFTPGSFVGFCKQIGSIVFIFGRLRSGGTISGTSYS